LEVKPSLIARNKDFVSCDQKALLPIDAERASFFRVFPLSFSLQISKK
jgi:hypothetical protein